MTLIEELHDAIQDSLHGPDATEGRGNVVTAWVVVAESMDTTGRKWLSRVDGGPGGSRLVDWQREGMLLNALHDAGWDDDDEDDVDGDE